MKRLLKDVDAFEAFPSTVVTDGRGNVLLSTPGPNYVPCSPR